MKSFLFKIFLYIGLIFVFSAIATYVLKEPLREADKQNLLFDKLRWKQFYSMPSNSVDLLFLGSSHAFRSFNPQIIDSATKMNSFVMGSAAQTPITSYYILKNVLLKQSPKTIVLENYFFPLFYETDQLDNGGNVYDNLEASAEKKEFFKNGFSLYDKCALTFAPILRYKNNYSYFIEQIFGKGELKHTATKYIDKGYAEVIKGVNQSELNSINMFDGYAFDSSKIDRNNISYFKKTIELCKAHNMRIILFTCPIPEATYKKIKNPVAIDVYFKKLSSDYGIEYYNYLNPQTVGMNSDSLYFSDYQHLNKNGAGIISEKISTIISRH